MLPLPPLDAWGLSGDVTPLPGGHRNTVLRVADHVLKTTRRSEAAIAWLLPVVAALQDHGLKAPAPLRSTAGRLVVDGWTCERLHVGISAMPDRVIERWPDFAQGTPGTMQRDSFRSSTDLCYVAVGGDIDLSIMPDPLVAALRAAWARLDQTPRTVVHGDLNASNILTDPDGQISIIDWDEARVDHPAFDRAALGLGDAIENHAALAWEIACCWQIEPQRAQTLGAQFLAQCET